MSDFLSPCTPYPGQVPTVVGQVVVEGILMRAPGAMAVAVRRPTGEIVVRERACVPLGVQHACTRWPVLRGWVCLIEGLLAHARGLAFAAEQGGFYGPLACAIVGQTSPPTTGRTPLARLAWALLMAAVGGFALVVLLPHVLSVAVGAVFGGPALQRAGFYWLGGGIKAGLGVLYLARLRRLPAMQRLRMYHGAQHKAIVALRAGLPLELVTVRRCSVIDARCGVTWAAWAVLLATASTALLLPPLSAVGAGYRVHVVVLLLKACLWVPAVGLAYELTHWTAARLHRPWVRALLAPALWLQRLTVCEPPDAMVEVALVALRAALSRSGRAPANESRRVRFGLDKLVGACARTGVRAAPPPGVRSPARVRGALGVTARMGMG